MFRNIGKKIKVLALVLFWISLVGGVLSSLIGGIAMIVAASNKYYTNVGMIFAGIGVMIIGSALSFLFSWIGSFFMYGFGQLIDDSEINRKTNQEILKKLGGGSPNVGSYEPTPTYNSGFNANNYVAQDPVQTTYAPPAQSAANKPWYCPRCGAKNTDGKFCYRCGTPNE